MSQSTTPDGPELDLPETVVVFGGGSKTYHAPSAESDDVEPRCWMTGRNPMQKTRELIETHYSPCTRCFSRRELEALQEP